VAFNLIFNPRPLPLLLGVCGNEILRKVLDPTLGRGKGSKGFKRKRFKRVVPVDLFSTLKEQNNNTQFNQLTRMFIDEFEDLVESLKEENLQLLVAQVATKLSFENKVMLLIIWIVKYPDYYLLSRLFGTTKSVVSKLLEVMLPLVAHYFLKFIPNEIQSKSTSSLSKNIVAIIDSTLHARNKPSVHQHLSYSAHYKRHGIMTTLLVDFDGYITSVNTGGRAILHDSMAATFMDNFRDILGENFALGDPGYAGVDYVISGFKSNQLRTEERVKFDRITRSEQVLIEHINAHFKGCKSLSKRSVFHHTIDKHVTIVLLVCGWYNWIKSTYGKFS